MDKPPAALDDITVFNDLRLRLAEVTDEQIVAAERRLTQKPEKEIAIGTVEQRSTRSLWVLRATLHAAVGMEESRAESAIDEHIEKEHREKAALLDMLEDVASELFWAQAKMDVGFYQKSGCGLRRGWVLVREPSSSGPRGMIEAIISGPMGGFLP